MSRSLGVLVLAVACWVTAADNAYACVCTGHPEVPSAAQLTRELRKDLEAALAVFVGEPIAMNALTIRFRVESVWKGELGTQVVMSTGAEATPDGGIRSSSCDFSFTFGQSYLVFAHGKTTETMKAYSCSFTGLVQGTELLDLLDGVAPRQQPLTDVAAKAFVAVIGSVRRPGLVEWSQGLTVARALALAGGAVPPVSPLFAELGLVSKIVRRPAGAPPEEHPALPTAILLPDDELFVADWLLPKYP